VQQDGARSKPLFWPEMRSFGVTAALALMRAIASLLYDVAPSDPVMFAAVAGMLAVTALASGADRCG
jgi:hypothetical protein